MLGGRSFFALSASLASLAIFVVVFAGGATAQGEVSESGPPDAAPGGDRPNIVFFMTDDLDKELVESLGSLNGTLSRDAVNFDRAYISDPFCCPSRATTLTGLYVQNHGIKNNAGVNGGATAFREKGNENKTVALGLQKAGYRTSLVGKYFNGNTTRIPPGWDDWHGWVGDIQKGSYKVNNNGRIDQCRLKDCHDTDYLSRKSEAFIRESAKADEPFFLYHATNAPHDPKLPYVAKRYKKALPGYKTPRTPSYKERDVSDKPRWVRTNQKKKTGNYVAALDRSSRNRARAMLSVRDSYNRLVKTLKETGEYDNTYIIFTSDQGKFVGDHGLGVGKRTPYLHDVEVPLFIKGPGVVPHKEARLTSNVDFYSTFMEIAGVEGRETDGRSIMPLLENERVPWRKRVFVEGYAEASARAPFPVPTFTEAIEQKRTYTRYATGEQEYYNLKRDPYQLENQASKNGKGGRVSARKLSSMRATVRDFQGCEFEECRRAED